MNLRLSCLVSVDVRRGFLVAYIYFFFSFVMYMSGDGYSQAHLAFQPTPPYGFLSLMFINVLSIVYSVILTHPFYF